MKHHHTAQFTRARWLKHVLVPLGLVAGLLLTTGQASAQSPAADAAKAAADFPNKPIRLVVPFPAGGSSDAMGRLLADKLAPLLKASVVVDNKGGAGGIIGTDMVAKSAADGYTLVLVDVFHSSTPIYTRKMPYDAVKDFSPVSLIGRSPAFLVTHANFEAKSGADLLKFARANPEKLSLAIAGTGSVVVDLFTARSGVKFVPVPYRGSSPAMTDLMAGQVNAFITTMASAGPHVKSGKLRALAVTGGKRHPEFPDVPTFAELGVNGMDYEQWFGVMAPANTPKPIVDKLSAAIAQVLALPDVKERLSAMALDVATPGPAEMKAKLESDVLRWQRLAKELDIKPLD